MELTYFSDPLKYYAGGSKDRCRRFVGLVDCLELNAPIIGRK